MRVESYVVHVERIGFVSTDDAPATHWCSLHSRSRAPTTKKIFQHWS